MRLFCLALILAVLGTLPPPMVLAQRTAPPAANTRSASGSPRLFFAGRPLPVLSPGLAPYRDPVDDVVCVAPEALETLGIFYRTDTRGGTVSLSGPMGDTITVRARRGPDGRLGVPVVEALEGLGAACQMDRASNSLHIRAVLTSVEMFAGQLRIKATLPVTARVTNVSTQVQKWAARDQVIVDVAGAEIGSLPPTLPITGPNYLQVRTGQFNKDTARIVFDLKNAFNLAPPLTQPTTQLVLNPLPEQAAPARPSVVVKIPPDPVSAAPSPPRPAAPAHPTTTVSAVTFRRLGEDRAQIVVSAGRAPRVGEAQMDVDQGRLTLNLLDAVLSPQVTTALADVNHPLLRAVQVVARGTAASQLIIDITRQVQYTVEMTTAGLVVNLGLPRNAGGKLAGKLVVVDPGHGGSDAGAKGINGTWEKNVNLAISKALRDQLTSVGANVIMTRSSDTFPSLSERPQIANRNNADFFLSVHSDSAGRNRSISGSTVYYHKNIPSSRALGQSIARRLGAMGGISTKGARSDLRLYKSGLAVLRGARMVGVLIECGFMTNPGDVARLNDPAMRKKIAGAIADGLRDYVEGYPYDTKNVNPSAQGQQTLTLPFDTAPGGDPPGASASAHIEEPLPARPN